MNAWLNKFMIMNTLGLLFIRGGMPPDNFLCIQTGLHNQFVSFTMHIHNLNRWISA